MRNLIAGGVCFIVRMCEHLQIASPGLEAPIVRAPQPRATRGLILIVTLLLPSLSLDIAEHGRTEVKK